MEITDKEIIKKIDERVSSHALNIIEKEELSETDVNTLFTIKQNIGKTYIDRLLDNYTGIFGGSLSAPAELLEEKGEEDVQQSV